MANECKGCNSVPITDEEIKRIFGRMVEGKKLKLVDKKTYNQRLEECYNCEYLESGNTCGQCGCIIEIKAKLSAARCPYPVHSRWDN